MKGAFKLTLLATLATTLTSSFAIQSATAQSPIDTITPVTDEMLLNPPDGDWLMWRRTYDGWGYSPLTEITKENVGKLQLAWSWGMSPGGRTQETPLVHDGVMFIQNSNHVIQALNAATGELIWEYEHSLPDGVAPNGERSKAIYGDKLIIATRDAHLVAIDIKTGQLAWDQQVADHKKGYAYTSGPLVAEGVVIQGMTNCSSAQPGGCFYTGHDAETGAELWRFQTIARGDTPEGNSWNGLPLESRHGGSAWITGSYDAEQGLIFAGVGQPYPWPAVVNGLLPASEDPNVTNDALYTNATLALDPKTGDLKWYFQHMPNDSLDLDYVYERLIIDGKVDGEDRKMVVTTGKTGIIEALDRTTGEWLWHKETVPQNVVLEIDPETGKKTINPDVIPQIGETTFNCPADPGGKAWQATSYSPRTDTIYLPLVEFCANTTPQPIDPGTIYTSGGRAIFSRVPVPESDGNFGRLDAVKVSDQSTTWSHRRYAPLTTSTLPTAGGVVFAGTLDRKMMAFDDETGDVLWESGTLSNALESFPISYEADGKQYIAVVSNWASGLGRLQSLTPDIKLPSHNPATVYVFALPND